MRVLIDTSAWIHFFRGTNTVIQEKVRKLLLEDRAVICPIIYQEILQGLKSEAEVQKVSHLLIFIPRLKVDPYLIAFGAAEIYTDCRRQGITIRKSQDCQIAFFCSLEGVALLHDDKDFFNIAKLIDLEFH
jgi:predicted nucleic acid-binding protein